MPHAQRPIEVTRRRLAIAALVLGAAAVAGAVAIAIAAFPRGLLLTAVLAAALPLAWWAVQHRGAGRLVAGGLAVALLAGALAVILFGGMLLGEFAVLAGVALALAAARGAFAARANLPPAPRPAQPVMFWNPRAGGGKAEAARLDHEARQRGITPVRLEPGDDLADLVRDAVESGADALAAAGGDGTQAVVAAAAAEHGLPYACIPAGTRNHFALDLGVDRDDLVGALDALVDGRARLVDLAEVNGRVFVNNVSLGVYAEAVQRDGYRESKLRTIARTLPETLGPSGTPLDLQWEGPDGREHRSGAVILVSNNPYRLHAVGAGTRPRMDTGTLGVAALTRPVDATRGRRGRLLQWAVPEFEVRSAEPLAAGLDGEAVVLDPPVRFRTRPGALEVRVAAQHPGASPSADLPDSMAEALRRLAALARGHAG